jgi:hypothetical protein
MAKAVALTLDALSTPQITPKAATPARVAAAPVIGSTTEPTSDQVPLQIRIPRAEARAIKVAAAQRDQSISAFMLSCVHAYMKSSAQ